MEKKEQRQWQFFKQVLPQLIVIELFFKLGAALIVKPLMGAIFNLMLAITGYQLAFNSLIVGFFLTVPGVIAIILCLLLAIIFIYWEFASLIILFYQKAKGEENSIQRIMKLALLSLRNLKHPTTIGFALYVLGLLPLVSVGFASSLLPWLKVPNFISGEITKNSWGIYAIIALVIILVGALLVSLYLLPEMVLGNKSFGSAFMGNATLVKKQKLKQLKIDLWPLLGVALAMWLPKLMMIWQFD